MINVLVGLLRMKVAAVLLGPAGVGVIGLLTNIVATGAGVAGLGVGTVGTRQIAEATAQDDPRHVWMVRRALFWLTLGLALVGGMGFWLLRDVLAARVLEDAALGPTLGWLSFGVALTVAAASQNALLNGLRRIGDIARVSVGSALLSSAIAILALWLWGRAGIVVFVLAAPLASFLLGHWYVAKLPRAASGPTRLNEVAGQWHTMLRLGFAFMVAGLAGTVGQLAVRTLVQRELGAEALGHFQASWAISMTYISFVLGAMGTDYYPRLMAVIEEPTALNRLVNEQTEVALLLAAPVLLAMLALAPWVIRLLYSPEFAEAADVLRWQVLGDLLKILSWPLGFLLLAAGRGKAYMGTQWLGMGVFFAATWLILPLAGVVASGVGFVCMYAALVAVNWALAVRRVGFAWGHDVKQHAILLLASGLAINLLAEVREWVAATAGLALATGWGVFALLRLAQAGGLNGPVGKLAAGARTIVGKLGVRRE